MADHLYNRVTRWCETCDTEQMVEVETICLSQDSTVELWECRCGEHHRSEFFQGDDD